MSSKLFTIAGTSTLKGTVKFRFATGTVKHRTLVLTRNDHTDIKLFELPTAMSKAEAKSFVESQLLMTPVAVVEPKAVVTPQVPALKGMTPLGFNLSECEDAPF
tara:strand:+ start:111 stop:422 length:312 start_codon:yes stop_codon:yes gene_type:complete